jgi:arginine utilization protein RocB
VGKVLPTAFVVGAPVHSGFPLRGLNAAVLAGAIAQRLEWAPELTDESAAEAGTPISLLALRDGKVGYDVTTPGTAWAYWNVLNHRRDPATVMRIIERLTREAAADCVARLGERARASGQHAGLLDWAGGVAVLRWSELLAGLRAKDAGIDAEIAAEAVRLRDGGLDTPEISYRLTALAWRRSGRSGPAVVLGLGSTPYLATQLRSDRVEAAVAGLVAEAPASYGVTLRAVDYFAGISDMSFWGQGEAGLFGRLSQETPAWVPCVGLHAGHIAQVPTVNLGPWGRDYHTPLERIETDYGFRVLPRLLIDLCGRLLG